MDEEQKQQYVKNMKKILYGGGYYFIAALAVYMLGLATITAIFPQTGGTNAEQWVGVGIGWLVLCIGIAWIRHGFGFLLVRVGK